VSGCSHPIRLQGWHERIDATTGELLTRVITAREPGGVLLVACGDRRVANCPSCAEMYRYDAFHLIAAGLRGGKGIPESIANHPALMITVTAPSFGRVHSIRDRDRSCYCGAQHALSDEMLGAPIDPTTYRYADQAIWNHLAPVLWKRTVQAVRREMARELGVSRHRLGERAQVRFVKVSEFQRRGVVHYHAVVRVDGPHEPDLESRPPCTCALLARVVRRAVRTVDVTVPGSDAWQRSRQRVVWGREVKLVRLDQVQVDRAAGYIAKYATKATELAAQGLLIPRVRSRREIAALEAPTHAKRLVEAAWLVGGTRGLEGARRWAHQFGYGGHTLTKSHDYSVTFGALREARAAWRAGRDAEPVGPVIRRGRLAYAGRGHTVGCSNVQADERSFRAISRRGSRR
jgi:hypothetical protein